MSAVAAACLAVAALDSFPAAAAGGGAVGAAKAVGRAAAGAPATGSVPAPGPSPASDAGVQRGSPTEFLKDAVARLQTILRKERGKARDAALEALAGELIDYGELGRRALGAHWDGRTEAERKEYLGLLQDLIEASYLREAGRDPDFTVQYEEEEVLDGGAGARVLTLAASGGGETEIEYRLMPRPGDARHWIVYDIAIDGVSMVANYRKSFGDIIRKEGFPALLKKMRKRLDDVRKGK